MALTAKVKDELLAVSQAGADARSAEATAMLRVAGEFVQGLRGIEIRADFAELIVAEHLANIIRDICEVDVEVSEITPGTNSRDTRYEVVVTDGARDVIRRFKLVTASGHPVVGLPRTIISGTIAEVEGAWRGAFLARGSLTEPGRTANLEVVCPRQETALALVGLARRLSVTARPKKHEDKNASSSAMGKQSVSCSPALAHRAPAWSGTRNGRTASSGPAPTITPTSTTRTNDAPHKLPQPPQPVWIARCKFLATMSQSTSPTPATSALSTVMHPLRSSAVSPTLK